MLPDAVLSEDVFYGRRWEMRLAYSVESQMPRGVEHDPANAEGMLECNVVEPQMPKGVEHTRSASRCASARRGRTSDAERR